MNTSLSSSSTFMRAFKTPAIAASLMCAALFSSFSANAQMSQMETININYRSPFEYALYLQTTEMLTKFHTGLEQKNIRLARYQTQAMAEEYSRLTSSSVTLVATNKHLDKKRILESAQ